MLSSKQALFSGFGRTGLDLAEPAALKLQPSQQVNDYNFALWEHHHHYDVLENKKIVMTVEGEYPCPGSLPIRSTNSKHCKLLTGCQSRTKEARHSMKVHHTVIRQV